jgi:hypothetical protein
LHEEKSKHAGLAHEIGFATAYSRLVKGASKVCAPVREE